MQQFAERDIPKQFGHGTEGDQAAFTSLYQEYFPVLYRYTLSRIRNKEQAEDIVQKVFLKLYSIFLESGRVTAFTEAYLFASVRNTLTDFFRKKKDIPFDTFDRTWQEIPSTSKTPDQEIVQQDTRSALSVAL